MNNEKQNTERNTKRNIEIIPLTNLQEEITMTSLEIAELTGKEHFNVVRDIEDQLGQLKEGVFKFEDTYVHPQNKQVYRMYKLPKREVLILVSRYNVQVRAKILDKLNELEEKLKQKQLTNNDVYVEVIDNTKKNNLPIFHFADYELDYALLDKEPLFNLNSVAEFLGINNPRTSIDTTDEDYVVKIINSAVGLTYSRTLNNFGELFLTEAGLYKLIMASKKPSAEKFQKWVVKEVLPSIRKTGSYSTIKTPSNFVEALELALEQAKQIDELQADLKKAEPKVWLADVITSSEDSINVGELVPLLYQNNILIGRNTLYKWFRNNGYLIKQRGREYNRPTQKSLTMGLFEVDERPVIRDDKVGIGLITRITTKGQEYFLNLFLKNPNTLLDLEAGTIDGVITRFFTPIDEFKNAGESNPEDNSGFTVLKYNG